MSDDITAAYALKFDALREVYLGDDATLVFLKLDSKDSSGAVFSSLKEVQRGWKASRIEKDGAIWTEVEACDLDDDLESIIEGEGHATHFALNGKVFDINTDQTLSPLAAPLIWRLRGVKTEYAYP